MLLFTTDKVTTSGLDTILNNMPQAVVILDRCDGVIYLNEYFEKMFGYNIQELKNKGIFHLLFPNDGHIMQQEYKKIIYNKHLTLIPTLRLNNRQNQAVWVDVTITNLLHNENMRGVLITAKRMNNKKREA